LGPGPAGPGGGGSGTDAPGPDHRPGHGGEAGATILSGPACRSSGAHWPRRGGAAPAGGGPGSAPGRWTGLPDGGGVPAPGRVVAQAPCPGREPGGGVFAPGPGYCPPSADQVVGAAGSDEPGTAVATPEQARRSPPVAGGGLRLVHRGL